MCCVDAEIVPVVTVVANEVGDFAEGLVRYDVLAMHGSGMGERFWWWEGVAEVGRNGGSVLCWGYRV